MNFWQDAPWTPRAWQRSALEAGILAIRAGKRPVISAIMGAGKSVLIAEFVHAALQKLQPNQKIIITAPRQRLVQQLAATIRARCGEGQVGTFWAQSKNWAAPVIVTCNNSAINLARILSRAKRPCAFLIGDEVHSSEAELFKAAFERIAPACAVGFTATPFRSNEEESLSLWDSVAYEYSAADALRDKVIVPWELHHWDGEGRDPKDVDNICADMIHRHINWKDEPGIVSALDIEDAIDFASFLGKKGIPAQAIHSGMSIDEQERTIDFLKRGITKVLVHVSLLSEGVDMPWLKWICLRRPVGAKVRFVQEVGRVLRSHPEKDRAIILDPHDLFGKHGLTNPAAIGKLMVEDEDKELLASLKKLKMTPADTKRVREMPAAVAFGHIESWVRSIISLFQANNMTVERQWTPNNHWRGTYPTAKQLQALQNVKWASRYFPKETRENFKKLFASPEILKRGTVSDMLDILRVLADQSSTARSFKCHWKFPEHLKLPEPDMPTQGLLFAMENN
jgi:superfamily II DNA or RNA helicase